MSETSVTENEKRGSKKDVITIIILAILLAIVLVMRSMFMFVQVDGASMENTLNDGDVLIVNKHADIEHNSIIVFSLDDEKLIKRVVAISGDEIYCDGNNLYLKKQGETEFSVVEEPYVKTQTLAFNKVTVSEGYVFVLGDNRSISNDSRIFGQVSLKDVDGVVSENSIAKKTNTTKIFGWLFNLRNKIYESTLHS